VSRGPHRIRTGRQQLADSAKAGQQVGLATALEASLIASVYAAQISFKSRSSDNQVDTGLRAPEGLWPADRAVAVHV